MQRRKRLFQRRNSAHMHTNTEQSLTTTPSIHTHSQKLWDITEPNFIYFSPSSIHLGEHKY